jgi:hypothetical protein
MSNVQTYSVLYNNAVRSVIYEGLSLDSHVESTCITRHHFTKTGGLGS